MIALWMQSQRIARERDLAQKERNHAQQERDHAEHVAQFLTDVFKAADPADSLSRDQPIGTVLDNARKRLDAHLGDEPGQRVRMLSVLAGVSSAPVWTITTQPSRCWMKRKQSSITRTTSIRGSCLPTTSSART